MRIMPGGLHPVPGPTVLSTAQTCSQRELSPARLPASLNKGNILIPINPTLRSSLESLQEEPRVTEGFHLQPRLYCLQLNSQVAKSVVTSFGLNGCHKLKGAPLSPAPQGAVEKRGTAGLHCVQARLLKSLTESFHELS